MNIQSGNTFDPTGDILEIGLMAATSPDFPDRLIRALMAAADSAGAPDETVITERACHPDRVAIAEIDG
jgi:uncharacterized membrane protein YebE (DUF533 family)